MFNDALTSTTLPWHVRLKLITAAQVDPQAPVGCSVMRTRAVESAIAFARNACPKLFKPEA